MAEKWVPGLLESALGGVQERKWLPPGSPRRPPKAPRGSKIDSKSRSFYQCTRGGSKTSPPGRPGEPFGAIFSVFLMHFGVFPCVYCNFQLKICVFSCVYCDPTFNFFGLFRECVFHSFLHNPAEQISVHGVPGVPWESDRNLVWYESGWYLVGI